MIAKISNPNFGGTLRNGLSLILLFLISLLFLQCSENPVTAPTPSFELTAVEKSLIESDNNFGLKLFKEINQSEASGENIFISPLSVAMALGMTYNGADGSTQEAMQQTLELSGLTLEEINESYKRLINLLTQLDPKVQFQIANSIWYREDIQPEAEFLYICNEYFNALVTGLNFCRPDAASIINAWVEENTNGKIKEIVDNPIDPAIVMFLINAIYFKGRWSYRFDEDLTHEDLFVLRDGSTTPCQVMAQKALHKHYSNEDFRAVELPYGDGIFSMTLFLPSEKTDLNTLIDQFSPDNLSYWISCFSSDSLNIFIPKFTLEYERRLNDDLTALGMGIAFTPGADFTRMYAAFGVWINKVKHKTFVEVNEEGTKAAAVTSVEMEGSSGDDLSVFRVDRPFVFMIRENESGTIMFIGKIVDPTGG